MGNPLISVIIPTLNCCNDLVGALESMAQQSLRNVELILSDGGSTDGTLDTARQELNRHKFPYCIIEKPGSSIYGAMNLGMKIARGEWLFFLGSDDRLASSDVFEKLSPALLDRNHHLVYGDVWIVSQCRLWCGGEFTARSLGRWNIPHQGTFYRRSTISRLKMDFNDMYPVEADWDFNLRLWKRVRFSYVDLVVVNYAGNGVSSRVTETPLYDRLGFRILDIYGLRAFAFLPSYRLAEACRSHRNPLIRLSFAAIRLWEAVERSCRRFITHRSVSG